MKSKCDNKGCKAVMVQGTASSAGKSVVAAALCRIYARRGLRVVPFKAQNMSLNSCVTPDGLEMGRAQGMQAEAAGVEQDARMNPILLKPSSDHKSQVIVMGRVHRLMNAREYYRERAAFRPVIKEAYESLCAENDLVVIEGAGSPAEINLRENDLVNMGMAAMADAPVILVGDIDRGGVFASLYGTVKLLDEADQARIKGLVINKFRGDVGILEPGLREIEGLLGIPVLGVLPYVRLNIDEEDSLAPCLSPAQSAAGQGPENEGESTDTLDIAVIRLPRISNFTDFAAFSEFPGVRTRYVSEPSGLGQPHLVILPGTKCTMADLDFLRETGFEEAILRLARQGRFIIGICGGFQMLGKSIHDPELVEGIAPDMPGLGLLNMRTFFSGRKKTVRTECRALDGPGLFKGAAGRDVSGYEIHMGHSVAESGGAGLAVLHEKGQEKERGGNHRSDRVTGFLDGSGCIFGTYLHGFFDNAGLTEIIINNMMIHFGLEKTARSGPGRQAIRQESYNELADMVEKNLNMGILDKVIGIR